MWFCCYWIKETKTPGINFHQARSCTLHFRNYPLFKKKVVTPWKQRLQNKSWHISLSSISILNNTATLTIWTPPCSLLSFKLLCAFGLCPLAYQLCSCCTGTDKEWWLQYIQINLHFCSKLHCWDFCMHIFNSAISRKPLQSNWNSAARCWGANHSTGRVPGAKRKLPSWCQSFYLSVSEMRYCLDEIKA